jgi:SPP1 gp7 family putative phage head morphogenesis protein
MWSAHEVDGRIAAKNAVKIRAALRNSIDARRVFENYLTTQPAVSVNEGQDRARARAWALLNLRINNEALKQALLRLYAEAWVTGDLVAKQEIQIALSEQSKSADITKAEDDVMIIDWDKWLPGDPASAMLLDQPQAFQELVSRSGNLITGLDKTGYELIGSALEESIRLGLSPSRAAKRINETIGSPARALSIAITESSRVMNASAMNRYKESGIKQHKWMPVLAVAGGGVACERCAQNTGQVVNIGALFNSGNTQPPAHPHCRCNLQPVLPDYSELFDKDGNYVPPPVNQHGVTDIGVPSEPVTIGGIKKDDLLNLSNRSKNSIMGFVNAPVNTRGDIALQHAYDIKGYNGLPQVLSPAEFEKAASKADVRVYRGIAGVDAAKYAEAYKTGEHYAGYGVFGNGTYTSINIETAIKYSGAGVKPVTDNPFGQVLDILIPDKSKYIEQNKLFRLGQEARKAVQEEISVLKKGLFQAAVNKDKLLEEAINKEIQQLENAYSWIQDNGTLATLLGYDGMYVNIDARMPNGEDEYFYIILNRAKVIVKGNK